MNLLCPGHISYRSSFHVGLISYRSSFQFVPHFISFLISCRTHFRLFTFHNVPHFISFLIPHRSSFHIIPHFISFLISVRSSFPIMGFVIFKGSLHSVRIYRLSFNVLIFFYFATSTILYSQFKNLFLYCSFRECIYYF